MKFKGGWWERSTSHPFWTYKQHEVYYDRPMTFLESLFTFRDPPSDWRLDTANKAPHNQGKRPGSQRPPSSEAPTEPTTLGAWEPPGPCLRRLRGVQDSIQAMTPAHAYGVQQHQGEAKQLGSRGDDYRQVGWRYPRELIEQVREAALKEGIRPGRLVAMVLRRRTVEKQTGEERVVKRSYANREVAA